MTRKFHLAATGLLALSLSLQTGARADDTIASSLAPQAAFQTMAWHADDRPYHSDIAFYETIFSHQPIEDPRLPFLLANAYIVTSQHEIGIGFFEQILETHGPSLSPGARSTHMAAYALLRATHADDVNLLVRIGWVNDTFDLLEAADRLANGQNPLVHWAAGIIYTQVPRFFGKSDAAERHLQWLAERPETEPLPGFYREAYRHLALLADRRGDAQGAARFRTLSGYGADAPDTLFTGWFATSEDLGLRFSPTPWIEDIVDGEIYAIRGHGFSDLHFIVSADRSTLIAIDAGTQPFSFAAALEQLYAERPGLPPLGAVLITHAHWDHVGGQVWIRETFPDAVFYGRENSHGVLHRAQRNHSYAQLRSAQFQHAWIHSYEPDVRVPEITDIVIGGSGFRLVPVQGGETEDAMLIRHNDSAIVFGGDTLMPFYGEPTVEEGNVPAALETMDAILALQPSQTLHGHYGITVLYGDNEALAGYRDAFAWLVETAAHYFENGYAAEEIIRMNLIPPSLLDTPSAFLGYVAPRDHLIRRLGDSYTGIWREDSSGLEPRDLDTITRFDRGRALDLYFNLSAGEAAQAIERMLDQGDLELALETAIAAETRYDGDARFPELRRDAADRLRAMVQFFDPFKFTIYTEIAGREHPGMPARDDQAPQQD